MSVVSSLGNHVCGFWNGMADNFLNLKLVIVLFTHGKIRFYDFYFLVGEVAEFTDTGQRHSK